MTQQQAGAPGKHRIGAVLAGNALEFYDFLSFSFFSVNLARVMFPADQPGVGLLLTLATAAVGFVARPLGAVVIGLLGDRIGRKPAMLMTFFMMGIGSAGLALAPTYAQIGVAAPILVVVLRIIQGLAAGGDIGPSTAYLIEAAPPGRRGFFASLQMASLRTGALMSGLVGLGLASVLTPAQLDAFGWRIAFGIGAVIVPFAFILRRRLDETLTLPETDPAAPTRLDWGLWGMTLVGLLGMLTMAASSDFLYLYAVTYLEVASKTAFWLTIIIGGVQVALVPISGWLSDKIGRRIVILIPVALGAATILPLFAHVVETRSFGALLFATFVSAGLTSAAVGAIYARFVETTPKLSRSGAVGIGYGLLTAAANGGLPLAMAGHIKATGDLATPGYVYLAGALLTLVSLAAAGRPRFQPIDG